MDLEKRVKSLEHEVNILKNEIQRTLLDIQEQVLTHYYPALRQAEPERPEHVVNAIGELRASREEELDEARRPVVKKVSLDELRSAHSDTTDAVVSALPVHANRARAAAPRAAGANVFQTTMLKLSDWVSGAAAQIGAERASALASTCAAHDIIAPDMAAVLVRLAALHQEPAPESVSVSDALGVMLKLYELLGRPVNVEEVLGVIGETNLG